MGSAALNLMITSLCRIDSPPFKILGTVESRAQMYRDRLLLTQQRLLRSDVFTLHGFSGNSSTKRNADGLPVGCFVLW